MLASLSGWSVTPGVAPHYRPGLMATVARNRGLSPAECMVSSPTVGIAEWVYVYGKNTGALRYCKVVDTSESIDRARHIRTGRAVELSYATALILCGVEHIKDRPEQCPVLIVSEY